MIGRFHLNSYSFNNSLNFLLIGGGGSGARNIGDDYIAGGGGAGGYLIRNKTLPIGSYSIIVGSGGQLNQNGGNSSIGDFVDMLAYGGGSGSTNNQPGNGGSGGGSGTFYYGTGLTEQGFDGGAGRYTPYGKCAGGGGGAAASGQTGYFTNYTDGTTYYGGRGGNGKLNPIPGSTIGDFYIPHQRYYLASGGGGGSNISSPTRIGYGGVGGGGDAYLTYDSNTGQPNIIDTNAMPNTGGGGGGNVPSSVPTGDGGCGGSGLVAIWYPTGSINISGGTVTYSEGFTVHTFTESGTLIIN